MRRSYKHRILIPLVMIGCLLQVSDATKELMLKRVNMASSLREYNAEDHTAWGTSALQQL